MTKLKEMREMRGLTQAEVADKAGVRLQTYSYYEQGFRDINQAAAITVYRISQALRCAPEDLLNL